jgi:hypothetical protein
VGVKLGRRRVVARALVEESPEGDTFVRSFRRSLNCGVEHIAGDGASHLEWWLLLAISVKDIVLVVACLPVELGIIFVRLPKVPIISIDVQIGFVDTPERHEMRFAVVELAMVESFLPRAHSAISWIAAVALVVEPARAFKGRLAANKAEAGATFVNSIIEVVLRTKGYRAP